MVPQKRIPPEETAISLISNRSLNKSMEKADFRMNKNAGSKSGWHGMAVLTFVQLSLLLHFLFSFLISIHVGSTYCDIAPGYFLGSLPGLVSRIKPGYSKKKENILVNVFLSMSVSISHNSEDATKHLYCI